MPKQPTSVYTLSGRIHNQENQPVQGLIVRAYDRDPNTPDNPLGQAAFTDSDGTYDISFPEVDFKIGGKESGGPDLFIRVYDDQGTLLGESDVSWNAGLKTTINLGVYQKTENEILLDLALSGRNVEDLSDLPEATRQIVNKLLNLALENRFMAIAGAGRSYLREALSKVGIDYQLGKDLTLHEYFNRFILPEIEKLRLSGAEIDALRNFMRKHAAGTVRDLLQLDGTFCENAAIKAAVRRIQTVEFAKMNGLEPATLDPLTGADLEWADIDEATLMPLLDQGTITATDRDNLLLTADLTRLTGGNLRLIKTLKTVGLQSLEDLVALNHADWLKLIEDNHIPVPDREPSAAAYAENLRKNIEVTFPTRYFFERITKKPDDDAYRLLDTVERLRANNETIIVRGAVNPGRLNWKGINARDRAKMEDELRILVAFANTYHHLGVTDIINDAQLDASEKKRRIEGRLGALAKFWQNNRYVEFAVTNFLHENSFNWAGITDDLIKPVRKQLLAYQRVGLLSQDFQTRITLLTKGFYSATAIAGMTEKRFAALSGLEYAQYRPVYLKALEHALVSAHFFEAVRDATFGTFNLLAVSNLVPLLDGLKDIDGLDDLFGSQNFCDCEHCRSIFSPAAYFTDLMDFIEEHVSVNLPDNSPLHLKKRRPDLWDLQLTCENTNEEIPYLQCVNEVLEAYLKNENRGLDVYDDIHNAENAITLPVCLPLEELRLYVSHFGLKLYQIYQTLGALPKDQLREVLKISEEELTIITTPAPDKFPDTLLALVNVQKFLELARIKREELDDLLKTGRFPGLVIDVIEFPGDIQKQVEVLIGLNAGRLDIIHRYLRLWKKTDWTIREFDLLLDSLIGAGLIDDSGGTENRTVLQIANLAVLKEELHLSAEELAAVVDTLPRKPVKDNQKSLYERLFNLEKIFGVASVDTDGIPIFNTSTYLRNEITPWLLAGLGIDESDLNLLLERIGTDRADQTIDYVALSRLYRYARLSRALKWSVGDLLLVTKNMVSGNESTIIERLHQLIEFNSWLKKSPFSIAELAFIIDGTESSSRKFESNDENSAALIWEIYKTIYPKQERSKDKKQLRRHLVKVRELLYLKLQEKYNLTSDQLHKEVLPNLVTVDAKKFENALFATFSAEGQPDNMDDFAELTALRKQLERIRLLFNKLEFSADAITFFVNHKSVFGISDSKHLKLAEIKLADFYRKLTGPGAEAEQELKIQHALTQYQNHLDQQGGALMFNEESLDTLATRWGQPLWQLRSLNDTFSLPSCALAAAERLQELSTLAGALGLEGENLQKLTDSGYEGLCTARDVVFSAFASKYPDEAERNEKLGPYNDKINAIKRDALCDYIIAKDKLKDRSDLYNYFLLDVEMSDCFSTSRLVAAISSLQLYVHRCLVNLEQSVASDIKVIPTWIPAEEWEWRKNYRVWEANRKVFLYPENYIDPTLRDNKTHIFKELEDELLQEKITRESAEAAYKKYVSRFSELTRLRFAGAYYESVPIDFNFWNFGITGLGGYFLVTGIYFSFESEDSRYYLFARTNTDPYQYYYRTYNHYKQVWGNWIKMEVAIEADEISALVFQGKLYVFWTEVQTKEINNISEGNATSDGAIFKVYTKYCFLQEDGKWTTPQRVYLGYLFADQQVIFERAIGDYPDDEKDRDQKHDDAFSKFEKKVFRKPYVQNSGQTVAPLNLYYMWSQNQEITTKKYRVPSSLYKISDLEFYNLQTGWCSFRTYYYTEEAVFTIPNNIFSNAVQSVDGRFIQKINGVEVINEGRVFTFHLESATKCTVQLEDNTYTLPVIALGEVTDNIKASKFRLSLSKNELYGSNSEDIDHALVSWDIDNNNYSFLKKEYNTAFAENGGFSHYIETGDKNFTSAERTITQSQAGDGALSLAAGGVSEIVPATTILTDELTDILYAKGLEQFLSLQTQQMTDNSGQQLDMKGAYGEYYWELFFHIPFLIANHLNANQKFKEAKWWYERIFNPTSEEEPALQKPSDHNWQFRAFRNLDVEKLQDILTDDKAIEAYREDPFNPHAIARLRISAYQKAIVMKYIDNLLDWGDYLFTQDTRESINEATMLYVLAQDILGKRPVKTGKCKVADETQLTYDKMTVESEFLPELENAYWTIRRDYRYNIKPMTASKHLSASLQNANRIPPPNELAKVARLAQQKRLSDMVRTHPSGETDRNIAASAAPAHSIRRDFPLERVAKYDTLVAAAAQARVNSNRWVDKADTIKMKDLSAKKPSRPPALDVVKRNLPAFCVPHNEDLLDYWDRVEDRLYKIRNCMNISGIRRSLALFQPPIDPMLLVRAKAAGLSLEDILTGTQALPPYRFEYVLEKAKQFTQTVQGFGNALLSALEKKDVEELTLLRSIHEQNILKLTKDVKRKQIEEARAQYESTQENLKNVEYRISYYQELIDTGLIPGEKTQQNLRNQAGVMEDSAGIFRILASYLRIIPQNGAPTSMNFGGQQLGHAMDMYASAFSAEASRLMRAAETSGVEAGHQRREQEWKQQLTLAEQEYKQVEQQVIAAEIRLYIAEKELEIHDKTIEQAKELYDFYRDKFTNLGLYYFLSSNLSRIYRQAYNMAADMARMAEQAYQFELNDTTFFIAGGNWESDKAGLLAGDRLALQLQQMEAAFLENNKRKYEITQSFSLKQIDPYALILLRKDATCTFALPEALFDLFYPGQYKRIIKSVRLSIPCIAGPYTNIGCKLTLDKSWIRTEANIAADKRIERIQGKAQSIATSNAQNDGGVFELNFRDERYLPFEGAGADSEWTLELPEKFRSFDYATIADVIIHVSYTAEYDDVYKGTVEENLLSKLNELAKVSTETGLFRLFDLKHDFPNEWHQFEAGGSFKVEVKREHFLYFAQPFKIAGDAFKLIRIKEDIQEEVITLDFTLVKGTTAKAIEIARDKIAPEGTTFLLVQYSLSDS